MTTYLRFAALLVIASAIAIIGCKRKEPVKIGFLGGLSGRNAELGIGGINGATLAIEKANLSGGVQGAPLELLVKDDTQNPQVAVNQVEELLKSGVRIIIGPLTSSIAAAVIPVVNKSSAVLISPTVTSTDFTGMDDQFLRVCGTVKQYAAHNADYQYSQQGKRRAAIIYDQANSSYSNRWMSVFTDTFTARGGVVTTSVAFTSGKDVVFLDMARKILATGPDLVIIIANSVDASFLTQQLRKLKADIDITLAEWASSERFIELTGSYAEGIYVSQFMDRNSTSPSYRTFLQDYQQRFGHDAGFPAVTSYDAIMVAITALNSNKAALVNPKEAIIAIRQFQGLQAPVILDRFGDSERTVHLSVIRNGKFQTVY